MSGELEAAGAMATAGLAAGVIEGREPGGPVEGACLNCGEKVVGAFCSQCGQSAHPHRSLLHVAEELLHGLFHFDTKAWRTLPMVVFRPGTLTRNYVYGKRARYISPLTLFLLTIFLMFFAFSFVRAPIEMGGTPEEQRAAAVEGLSAAREALADAEQELAQEQTAPAPTDGTPRDLGVRLARQAVQLARAEVSRREEAIRQIDAVMAQQRRATAAAETQSSTAAPSEQTGAPPSDAPVSAEGETPATPEVTADVEMDGVTWEAGETWQDGMRRMARSADFNVVEGNPELNERIRQKFENPDLALYRIQEAASTFSFLLVPLSVPFIALLFLWRRGVTLYDHVVFTLYALSFASLLFVTITIAASVPWLRWSPGLLLLVGLPIHTFFHFKGAYQLGWFSALWRTLFMLIFASVIAIAYVVIVVILGLTG